MPKSDSPLAPEQIERIRKWIAEGVAFDGADRAASLKSLLGPRTHPFTVVGDPSAANFEVKNLSLPKDGERRVQDRVALLRQFDQTSSRVDRSGTMSAITP